MTAAAVAAVLLLAMVAGAIRREARYEGRTVSYWLDQLPASIVRERPGQHGIMMLTPGAGYPKRAEADADLERLQEESERAGKAVAAIGDAAIPQIMRRLQVRDSRFKLAAMRVAFRVRLLDPRKHLSAEIRRGQALTALLRLKPDSPVVLWRLDALAREGSVSGAREARWALRQLSPDRPGTVGCADYAPPTMGQPSQAVEATADPPRR